MNFLNSLDFVRGRMNFIIIYNKGKIINGWFYKGVFFFFKLIFILLRWFKVFFKLWRFFLLFVLVRMRLFKILLIFVRFCVREFMIFWNMVGFEEMLKGRWVYWNRLRWVLIVMYCFDFLFRSICWYVEDKFNFENFLLLFNWVKNY